MAYHKSARIIQKNVYAWTDNLLGKSLSLQESTRRHVPKVDCITDFVRMPLKKHILGRYYFLLESTKSKKDRLSIVCKKLTGLRAKLNFSLLTEKDAIYRLICLIKQYEKYQRRPTSKFEAEMSKIFNITNSDEEWLCEENKKLYQNQVKFNSSIGYITNKKAPFSTIGPSKRKLLKETFNESCEPSTTMIVEAQEYGSSDGLSSANIANIEDEPPKRYR